MNLTPTIVSEEFSGTITSTTKIFNIENYHPIVGFDIEVYLVERPKVMDELPSSLTDVDGKNTLASVGYIAFHVTKSKLLKIGDAEIEFLSEIGLVKPILHHCIIYWGYVKQQAPCPWCSHVEQFEYKASRFHKKPIKSLRRYFYCTMCKSPQHECINL